VEASDDVPSSASLTVADRSALPATAELAKQAAADAKADSPVSAHVDALDGPAEAMLAPEAASEEAASDASEGQAKGSRAAATVRGAAPAATQDAGTPKDDASPAIAAPAQREAEQAQEEPMPRVAMEDEATVRAQEVHGLTLYHISSIALPPTSSRPRGSHANELLLW